MACYDATEPVAVWVTDRYIMECTKPGWREADPVGDDSQFAASDLLDSQGSAAIWTDREESDGPSSSYFFSWFGQPAHC